jgi:hypothetical protein
MASGWWLVADADLFREKLLVFFERKILVADKANEHGSDTARDVALIDGTEICVMLVLFIISVGDVAQMKLNKEMLILALDSLKSLFMRVEMHATYNPACMHGWIIKKN